MPRVQRLGTADGPMINPNPHTQVLQTVRLTLEQDLTVRTFCARRGWPYRRLIELALTAAVAQVGEVQRWMSTRKDEPEALPVKRVFRVPARLHKMGQRSIAPHMLSQYLRWYVVRLCSGAMLKRQK